MPNLQALLLMILLAGCGAAEAYIGPGAGLTVIGTVIAVIGALFLAVVGFLWYPIKRWRARRRQAAAASHNEDHNAPS